LSKSVYYFRLSSDLHLPWPPCLSVKELHILGKKNSSFDLLTSSITCPVVKVYFKEAIASQIYQLVDKLGPQITHLTIHVSRMADWMNSLEPLDMPRVLAACPKIKILKVSSKGRLSGSTSLLKPENFANYQE